MISRLDFQVIVRNRVATASPAQKRVDSSNLSADVELFLANGGKIEVIPFGKSSDCPEPGSPIKLIKEYERGRQNVINSRIAKRTPVEVLTPGTFKGAICPKDRTTLRYLSNADCVQCARERNKRKSKAMMGNSRRADSV